MTEATKNQKAKSIDLAINQEGVSGAIAGTAFGVDPLKNVTVYASEFYIGESAPISTESSGITIDNNFKSAHVENSAIDVTIAVGNDDVPVIFNGDKKIAVTVVPEARKTDGATVSSTGKNIHLTLAGNHAFDVDLATGVVTAYISNTAGNSLRNAPVGEAAPAVTGHEIIFSPDGKALNVDKTSISADKKTGKLIIATEDGVCKAAAARPEVLTKKEFAIGKELRDGWIRVSDEPNMYGEITVAKPLKGVVSYTDLAFAVATEWHNGVKSAHIPKKEEVRQLFRAAAKIGLDTTTGGGLSTVWTSSTTLSGKKKVYKLAPQDKVKDPRVELSVRKEGSKYAGVLVATMKP